MVVPESIVALECHVQVSSNPPPQIQWNDGLGLVQNATRSPMHFFDGGRFLLIIGLNENQLQKQYYCSLSNVITGDTINSSTKYVLTTDLQRLVLHWSI